MTTMQNYENSLKLTGDTRLSFEVRPDGRHYVDPVTEFGWMVWKLAKKEVLCPECDSFDFSSRSVDDDCGTENECRCCANIWRE